MPIPSTRQFKFDKSNPQHVALLKTAAGNDEIALSPGGLITTGMAASPQIEAQKNSKSNKSSKAVAKKPGSELESNTPKRKPTGPKRKPKRHAPAEKPNFLAKARAAEDAAKKRGDVSEGLENPNDKK